jgi:hypothetical protein
MKGQAMKVKQDFVVCDRCGIHLPLRKLRRLEKPQYWECKSCGYRLKAVFNPQSRPAIQPNARSV